MTVVLGTSKEIDWANIEEQSLTTSFEMAVMMLTMKFGHAARTHFENLGPSFLKPSPSAGTEPPELDVEAYDSIEEADSDDDEEDDDYSEDDGQLLANVGEPDEDDEDDGMGEDEENDESDSDGSNSDHSMHSLN
jgi:hypothetical protein